MRLTVPRPMRALFQIIAAAWMLLSPPVARGQEKELHWREMAVEARLDAEGRLHVRERQVMVFTGSWNGGHRYFRLEPGQDLRFHGISRLEGGQAIPLTKGKLDLVDHYVVIDRRTVRWRNRRQQDPPFHDTELTYVLDYTLSNIVLPQDDGSFRLDQDFAFVDRVGDIERFVLDLTLDDAWQTDAGFDGHWEAGPLPPGRGFVVHLPLRRAGAAGGRPAGVWYGTPIAPRKGIAILLVLAVALQIGRFLRRERAAGRFLPLTPPSEIGADWLEQRVFHLKPEIVGAAFDHTTSAPEVGAVIARMVGEGKLKSTFKSVKRFLSKHDVLSLELLVDEATLTGYEAALVTALFFGNRSTDTDRIKEHYKKSGFDPAEKIRAPIQSAIKHLLGRNLKAPELSLRSSLLIMIVGLIGLILAATRREPDIRMVGRMIVPGVAAAIFGGILAYHVRQRAMRIDGSVKFLFVIVGFLPLLAAFLLLDATRPSWLAVAAIPVFCYGICRFLLRIAGSRDQPAAMALRRDLTAARDFFATELKRREPRLQDAWVPYLIALGLGSRMDRWFRAFGDGSSAISASMVSGGSSGGSFGGGGGGWSGGGGAFGGAGATSSWAAMSSMASGVSSPSSGSDGGGGGSSSGGGGGGGW